MIEHINGDLFENLPLDKEVQIIIPHIVNDIGAWGSGFVVPLGKHFPFSKECYLKHYELHQLGDVQWINILEHDPENLADIAVMNMFAQSGIVSKSTGNRKYVNQKPIRYEALVTCLRTVNTNAQMYVSAGTAVEIHAPAFGSLRSGGCWPFIHELIEEILTAPSRIVIYYLDEQQKKDLEKFPDFRIS
jgi:hypothetical protein